MFEEENYFNFKNELNVRKRKLASFGRTTFVKSTQKTVISCRDGSSNLKGVGEWNEKRQHDSAFSFKPSWAESLAGEYRVILHFAVQDPEWNNVFCVIIEVPKNSDEEKWRSCWDKTQKKSFKEHTKHYFKNHVILYIIRKKYQERVQPRANGTVSGQ